MSEKKARFIGSPDGIYLPNIPVSTEGEPPRSLNIAHGGELPTEIDGHKIPASFRDSLLEQSDNWTSVNRSDKTTTAKAEEA
jgi:hypothetical protein